uniref:Arrestin-like N-terminal domain-containing protein n=1 Tax=Ciona savignyi TaxID=51511 RepID=H2Y4Z1_CIOSA
MPKLLQFYAGFDQGKSVYRPGEMVSGALVINLARPMNMRAVNIKFSGKANVHWSERHKSGKTTTTRHYRASEVYFEQRLCMYGAGSIGTYQNATELPAGQTSLPFQFLLPSALPSSFEG